MTDIHINASAGIGTKVTQSALTAALLFAFKDALYDMSVKARKTVAGKPVLALGK